MLWDESRVTGGASKPGVVGGIQEFLHAYTSSAQRPDAAVISNPQPLSNPKLQLGVEGKHLDTKRYRGTSFVRNSPPPYDRRRALGIFLL